MSFNGKTTWQFDEVVKESDLNRIEQGIVDAHAGLDTTKLESKAYTDEKVAGIAPSTIGAVRKSDFDTHIADIGLHVTTTKQAAWDAKETPAGAQAKANQAETNAKNASLSKAIYVPINTDLNNLINEGEYYNLANAEVSTMKNVPTFESFNLKVYRHAGVQQEFRVFNPDTVLVWKRNFYNNRWSQWIKVLDQRDYDMLFQSVNDGKNMIASAIIDKGGNATGSDTFSQLANKIKTQLGNYKTGDYLFDNGVNSQFNTIRLTKKKGSMLYSFAKPIAESFRSILYDPTTGEPIYISEGMLCRFTIKGELVWSTPVPEGVRSPYKWAYNYSGILIKNGNTIYKYDKYTGELVYSKQHADFIEVIEGPNGDFICANNSANGRWIRKRSASNLALVWEQSFYASSDSSGVRIQGSWSGYSVISFIDGQYTNNNLRLLLINNNGGVVWDKVYNTSTASYYSSYAGVYFDPETDRLFVTSDASSSMIIFYVNGTTTSYTTNMFSGLNTINKVGNNICFSSSGSKYLVVIRSDNLSSYLTFSSFDSDLDSLPTMALLPSDNLVIGVMYPNTVLAITLADAYQIIK
ncbi:pyocin knob domain-containing protein [Paenibacillus aquistagni]|uniref:pyocin knob domain-containing protein n=1 Tax=Paenibacillus aquistagni TaxID=1852522 RepID=UPI00145B1C10|nr:pyocin knob domain-containing protein [Paenibacillus aquistagni]NMM53521.1 hypothetical protein [Paenibacillus aquistagni]